MCLQYSRNCCRRALHPFTVVIVPGATGVTLSGGQQMRLALARAFYQQPQLIIADDPLAAVDAEVEDAEKAAVGSRWHGSGR